MHNLPPMGLSVCFYKDIYRGHKILSSAAIKAFFSSSRRKCYKVKTEDVLELDYGDVFKQFVSGMDLVVS